MNKVYEFMMKLQDMFSPQLMKMANTYGKVVGNMERKKASLGNVFTAASQSADTLRRKLTGLGGTSTRLRVDTSGLDQATRKAEKLRDSMGRFVGGGGSSGGGGSGGMLGNMMRGGALGGMLLGGLGGYLGMQGLQMANDSFIQPAFRSERNQFSTGVMLGDESAGKSLMSQLAKYAADNPVYDKPEVQAAGQLFVGVEERLDRIIPRLAMVGDIAAGSGNDLLGLTTIFAKIKAQGRVQGDELMQLMERRINILPSLASVKGVQQGDVSKLVSKGQVSYEDVMAALGKMTGEGGMYHNMGNRIANETQGGKYQKVLGDLAEKSEQIGMALLPYVTKIMEFVSQLLANMGPLESGFSSFASAVGNAWTFVSGLLQSLGLISEKGNAAQMIMETLGTIFTFLGNVIQIVTGVLEAFTNSPLAMLITGLTLLPWIIGTVQGAWVALNAAFIATPIGFIIAAVVGLVAALMTAYEKVDWFREGLISMWETAKSIFGNIGDLLKMILSGNVAGAMAVLGKAFSEGSTNSQNEILRDRQKRLGIDSIENRRKGRNGAKSDIIPGVTPPGFAPPSQTLGQAAGLTSSVGGNSKSNNITINVSSIIGKSEINVMDFQGDIGDLESKVIAAFARLINSANQIAVS